MIAKPIATSIAQSIASPITGAVSTVLAWLAAAADDDGVMQLQVNGQGTPTSSHTSSIYAADHEGVYREFAADEPVWKGGRVVENLCISSDDMTAADYNVFNGLSVTSPNTFTVDFNIARIDQRFSVLAGETYIISIDFECDVDGAFRLNIWAGGENPSPEISYTAGVRRRYSHTVTVGSDAQAQFQFYRNSNSTDTRNITVYGMQIEKVCGQSDTTSPGEYIPTTATAVKKVFSYANGNTVASNVVTEATGADLSPQPQLQYNPAATNAMLDSNNLSGGGWFVGGNAAVASDAEKGIDGNTGTYVFGDSGGGGTGIATISQGRTVTSGSSVVRVFAKKKQLNWFNVRVVNYDFGSQYTYFDLLNGAVGATQQNDAAEIVDLGNDLYMCLVEFSTTTDLSGTIYISPANANGDQTVDLDGTSDIYVFQAELHTGKTIAEVRGLPPIFTTTAAASIDKSLYDYDIANHDNSGGAYYFEWTPSFNSGENGANNSRLLSLNNSSGLLYYHSDNNLYTSDGTTFLSYAETITAGTTYKVGLVYHASDAKMQISIDGVWGSEAAYDGNYDVTADLDLFRDGVFQAGSENIQRWDIPSFAAGKAKIEELMA